MLYLLIFSYYIKKSKKFKSKMQNYFSKINYEQILGRSKKIYLCFVFLFSLKNLLELPVFLEKNIFSINIRDFLFGR